MKVKGLRWWVLGLIVLVTIINYLDRNTLGIMWAKIVEDLGLINTEGLSEAEYNDLVATVNSRGLVELVGGYGTATITARASSGAEDKFVVNVVSELPEGVGK